MRAGAAGAGGHARAGAGGCGRKRAGSCWFGLVRRRAGSGGVRLVRNVVTKTVEERRNP